MQFQRTFTLIFLLAFSFSSINATTYIFKGNGDYTDVSNWAYSNYPGTSINSDDVVIIDADATCEINDAVTLFGEFQNHGTVELDQYFTNLGKFINEGTGYFFMSNSASFRNHFFFYNRTSAKFFASNTFYNYYKFYNNDGASFVNNHYFYSHFEVRNNGYFENQGDAYNFESFNNFGTGKLYNYNTFHNDDDFKNYGTVHNKFEFINTSGGAFMNTAKLFNEANATFYIDASSEFDNNHGDVLNANGATIERATLSMFTNTGTFFGTGTFIGEFLSEATAQFFPNTEMAIGTYTIDGDYNQLATASAKIEISSAVDHDVINISHKASFNGTLDLELLGGYLPTFAGQEFTLFTYGDFTGSFSIVNFPDITGTGLTWNLVYDATELKLVASSVLPVELISFEANLVRNDVQLDWTTATEINNDFFAVEFSKNGRDFEKIGTVQSSGNSQELTHYSFIHRNAETGKNYYRLRQVDFGGNFEMSETKVVDIFDNSEAPIAFPNPVTAGSNSITLPGLTKGNATVRLFDNLGQLINQFELGTGSMEIQTQGFNAGAYHLEINNGGNISTQRIIVL